MRTALSEAGLVQVSLLAELPAFHVTVPLVSQVLHLRVGFLYLLTRKPGDGIR